MRGLAAVGTAREDALAHGAVIVPPLAVAELVSGAVPLAQRKAIARRHLARKGVTSPCRTHMWRNARSIAMHCL